MTNAVHSTKMARNDIRTENHTVSACCEENGIKKQSYYYHLRKIRESMLQTIEDNDLPPIVPLSVNQKPTAIKITIGKAEVEIPEGTTSTLISEVLKALNEIC